MQAEKVLLCLHCWGITTIRCPSVLAYGLANNNLVYILLQTSNGKLDCSLKKTNMFLVENSEINDKLLLY